DPGANITGTVTLAFALVDRLRRSEDQAVVGRAAAGERKSRYRECAEDIRISAQNLLSLPSNVGGVGKRRARRSLYYGDEVVLVLLRNESRGDVKVHVTSGREPDEEQHDHHIAVFQHSAD